MIRSARVQSLVLVVLVLGLATGCPFAPLPPEVPSEELNGNQLDRVLDCQTKIKAEGTHFIGKKLDSLETCVDRALEVHLAELHGQVNPSKVEQEREDAREACENEFVQIRDASRKFVDAVISKCGQVEDEVLGSEYGDPLGFKRTPYCNTEDVDALAGCLCTMHEVFADMLVTAQAPNGAGQVAELFGFYDGDEFTAWLHQEYLDPRCLTIGTGLCVPCEGLDNIPDVDSLLCCPPPA